MNIINKKNKEFSRIMSKSFDFIVIGGGSGGLAAAKRAAGYKAKVALIEKARLGGTCVNVGCVPKKVMYNTSTINETIHMSEHYGFKIDHCEFEWKKIKEERDAYVSRLNDIHKSYLDKLGVTTFTGTASFIDAHKISVDGKETLEAPHILIATGGRPSFPNIPGAKEYGISSNGFFEMDYLPKKVAVVGAGYIAVEMAGMLNGLGSDVTLFVRGDHPLRKFDDMIQTTLHEEMLKSGLKIETGCKFDKVEKKGEKNLSLFVNGKEHSGFNEILFAIGRVPETESLHLDKVGIKTKPSGHIIVDERENTNIEGVYCIGDLIGKVDLTPVAIAAGRKLADRLFGGFLPKPMDYTNVPTVVFSHPPIGIIGLTEAEAIKQYGKDKIKIYTSSFTGMIDFCLPAEKKRKTALKLICLLPEEKVIGLHGIGVGMDEILQGFGVAMKMGATKHDFDDCIAIHPTSAEEIVTLAPWGMENKK